ncbi:thiol reductant ABC exporter subunit CydC [Vreelandella venusta]|uniref:Thiol reductant ABC exporter subunit CydC n=1 Tax=Vreelandella venusta TaxID=44935 RepID=A0AAP9ZH61_9GAMM|nr:thiol reductant ABC exporter subunit CydC [Halomonas venusta]QRL04939.1 thiol reductant ABC exporter subunit CydC [Halomonas venusta]GEK52713.1 cysteine/glutathione ABC transporter ATP-binding protein/permease CydC [Halomonas venusta]
MKQFYREMKPWLLIMLRRRQRFFIGALLALVTLLAGLALLGLSGWFITACALAGIALAAGLPVALDIYVPGGGIRFFALLRTVARYAERLYNHNTVLTLLADLRYRVFGDLTRLDEATLKRRRASEWLSRLTSDIDTLDNLYLRLLFPPLVGLLSILIVSGFIALWVPVLGGLIAVVLSGLWLVVTLGYAWLGFSNSFQQVNDQEELRRLVLDQVQASAELMSYQTNPWYRARIKQHEDQALSNQRQLAYKSAIGNAFVLAVTGMLLVGVLWLGSFIVEAGQVAGPIIVMAVIAVLGINEVFTTLPNAFLKVGASYGAARRLNALSSIMTKAPSLAFSNASRGHPVAFNNVSFRYPDTAYSVLSDTTFALPAGERAVVTGVSGAGKSTLANLIMGRVSPSEGQVYVASYAPSNVTAESRAEHFALLTQQVDLFDGSLAANLRIANPEASDDQLWEALSQVALKDWVKQQPNQLMTQVGEMGQQLSGGQARRVALARIFLRDPSVVLLDEPFAGVDAFTAMHIAKSLDHWLIDRTAIFFIHQVECSSLLPGVNYHWRLAGGKLNADTLDNTGNDFS